jgi:hypothetical protein
MNTKKNETLGGTLHISYLFRLFLGAVSLFFLIAHRFIPEKHSIFLITIIFLILSLEIILSSYQKKLFWIWYAKMFTNEIKFIKFLLIISGALNLIGILISVVYLIDKTNLNFISIIIIILIMESLLKKIGFWFAEIKFTSFEEYPNYKVID